MGQPATLKRKRDAGSSGNENEPSVELMCDWINCDYVTTDNDAFILHVESHEPLSEHRETNLVQQEWYCCQWEVCYFSSSCRQTTRYHINYHAFHTRLKALGSCMMKKNLTMKCNLDAAGRNYLPQLPQERWCEWEGCNYSTPNYQALSTHANLHVSMQPRRENLEIIYCAWNGCDKPCKNKTLLKCHLKTHTQTKAVACPVCGAQFAHRSKLVEHCSRQAGPEERLLKCSYCKKTFSSHRVLQDHFRVHIHLHKCPMCDMTAPNKSALAMHIRFKHVNERPFSCKFCDHRSITEHDLKSHYRTHSNENCFACPETDCEFSARSKNGLKAHMCRAHGEEVPRYGCHICDTMYHRGANLTVHLKRDHAYRWASGQSRFRYTKDDSGIYRLQMVRYESLEVVEQIVRNVTIRKQDRRKKYTIIPEANNSLVIQEQQDDRETRDDSDSDNPDDDVESTDNASVHEQDSLAVHDLEPIHERDDSTAGTIQDLQSSIDVNDRDRDTSSALSVLDRDTSSVQSVHDRDKDTSSLHSVHGRDRDTSSVHSEHGQDRGTSSVHSVHDEDPFYHQDSYGSIDDLKPTACVQSVYDQDPFYHQDSSGSIDELKPMVSVQSVHDRDTSSAQSVHNRDTFSPSSSSEDKTDEFGESLKQHLGLTDGFICVVKSNMHI